LAPAPLGQVPIDRRAQASLKVMARSPAQFAADPRGIDGIAAVMTWPVSNRGDQAIVGCPLWQALIEQGADGFNHLPVVALSVTADAVTAAQLPLTERQST